MSGNRGFQRGAHHRKAQGRANPASSSSSRNITTSRSVPTNSTTAGSQPDRPPFKIGWRKLQELKSNESAIDVALYLFSKNKQVMNLLNDKHMEQDRVILILEVWLKICKDHLAERTSLECLTMMVNSEFLSKTLVGFFAKMNSVDGRKMIELTMEFCTVLLTRIPSLSHRDVFLLVGIIDMIMKGKQYPSTLVEKLQALQDLVNEVLKSQLQEGAKRAPVTHRWRSFPSEDTEAPPDDYRSISIFPQPRDLAFDEQPFLRRNVAKGQFADVDHYLDVNFRLLREDFIRPLREGIEEYKNPNRVGKLQNIRVYTDVRISIPADCTLSGLEYTISFDITKLSKVRWESSKRLIYGSLLCLSRDNFESILFCTVTDRKVNKLRENGEIKVRFEDFVESLLDISDYTYTMVETTAYFEASRHILSSLQLFNEGNMPFTEYIVKCRAKVEPPCYLKRMTSYDFSNIARAEPTVRLSILERLMGGVTRTSVSEVFPLKPETWLSSNSLSMDESQRSALMHALSKQLAIIQGPPGTGKTYVGLAIVRILVENWTTWNEENRPILVVCYTNHALDQFLEEITSFLSAPGSIIRVGGRSNNPAMESLLLKNAKQALRRDRKLPRGMFEGLRQVRSDMERLTNEIKQLSQKVNDLQVGIVSLNVLRPFMNTILTRYLPDDDMLIQWLCELDENGVQSNDPQQRMEFLNVDELQTLQKDYISQQLAALKFEGTIDTIELRRFENVWHLDMTNRWLLYRYLAMMCMERELKMIGEDRAVSIRRLLGRRLVSVKSLLPIMGVTIGQQLDDDEVLVQWLCMDDDSGDDEGLDYDDEVKLEEQERILDGDFDDFFGFQGQGKMKDVVKSNVILTFDAAAKRRMTQEHGGWQTVKKSRKATKKFIRGQLKSRDRMNKAEVDIIVDIWGMSIKDRWRLYRYLVHLCQTQVLPLIEIKQSEYEHVCKVYREIQNGIDTTILSTAKIIGMTTTGAARNQLLLRGIRPKITIVEEAAEVLESHIVTSLTEHCEHLILIGDHKQLKPSTTVYELSVNYNLNISFFERMIDNSVEYKCLQYQHRMRPKIAILMKHIYPELKNHVSVTSYENIKGVARNMFFITHNQPEGTESEIKSHFNKYEAEYIPQLCRYLLKQGYRKEQITVLTPYSGQMFQLKKGMPKREFEGIRLTLVDNFQGEENDIILLSLVRSEPSQKIGFLAIENRVCVALSRAKKGLYVVGNLTHLARNSGLWEKIHTDLKQEEACGPALELCCQNHPGSDYSLIQNPSDFDKFPNGCCSLICKSPLACGHYCSRKCHLDDMEFHLIFKCLEPCPKRLCPSGHKCPLKCWETCPPCPTPVRKILPCGHRHEGVPCSQQPMVAMCIEMCTRIVNCPHKTKCLKLCKETCVCDVPVSRYLSCKHIKSVPCYKSELPVICDNKCSRELPCGHNCTKMCQDPCGECKMKVDYKLSCGHIQNISCHMKGKAITCSAECGRKLPCGHLCTSQCCSVPCPPCLKLIKPKLKCGHTGPEMACKDVDINQIECNQKCSQILKCDHLCQGICGKDCLNGRIHAPCKQKVVVELICGHKSTLECASRRSICLKTCDMKCSHGQCSRACSETCNRCPYPCALGCEHSKCTKLCWEPCDRKRCNQPCSKLLEKCGHPCIGLCGEKCPRLCSICDIVALVGINGEYSGDSRFIELDDDCHHVIEVTRLDATMKSYTNGDQSVYPKCPVCNATIRVNGRHANILKECHQRHELKKDSLHPPKDMAISMKEEFVRCYEKLYRPHSSVDRLRLIANVKEIRNNEITSDQLAALGKLKDFTKELDKISTVMGQLKTESRARVARTTSHIIRVIVGTKFITLTNQQLDDISAEMQKLRLLYNVCEWIEENSFLKSHPITLSLEDGLTSEWCEKDSEKAMIKDSIKRFNQLVSGNK